MDESTRRELRAAIDAALLELEEQNYHEGADSLASVRLLLAAQILGVDARYGVTAGELHGLLLDRAAITRLPHPRDECDSHGRRLPCVACERLQAQRRAARRAAALISRKTPDSASPGPLSAVA